MIAVSTVDSLSVDEKDQLSDLLIAVVELGASVGWMAPPSRAEAASYWTNVIRPGNRLIVARDGDHIVGTAQLELAQRENGLHRAEVGKVLVHPDRQRKGIGLSLMTALDEVAREEKRTLLHLDTSSDDVAIRLYEKAGYTRAGEIPDWAGSPADGQLHGTIFFYKRLAKAAE